MYKGQGNGKDKYATYKMRIYVSYFQNLVRSCANTDKRQKDDVDDNTEASLIKSNLKSRYVSTKKANDGIHGTKTKEGERSRKKSNDMLFRERNLLRRRGVYVQRVVVEAGKKMR